MRRPLRILHVTTSGDVLAGAEQLLIGMSRLADRSAWDLSFCTLTPRDNLHRAIEPHGWPTHAMDLGGYGSLPRVVLRFQRLVAAFRPHVIHTHLSHATMVSAVAAAIDRRVRLVQTRHYSDYVARFRKHRLVLDAWAARRCDRIIAVSGAARDQLVEVEGVSPGRVVVIDNGVEWDRLAALDHAEGRRRLTGLGLPQGQRVIGCAATFNPRKGHTYLLRAMVEVGARLPDVHLVLLGTGDDEAKTRAEVQRLGLEERVHFLGHRPDGQALMAGFDVYVQPSVEEGFGLAVVEAMAMGLPVVTTAVGGMMDTVEPDRSGLRVPPADPTALAGALVRMLGDEALGQRLGRAASERVRTTYSLERMMAAYDGVYRDALSVGG